MSSSILLVALQLFATVPADTMVVPLEVVVVTGTRLPESLRGAPAAISVVDRRAYQDSRGISLTDALGMVPGVFAQSRAGAQDARITIRGFGARGNGRRQEQRPAH